MGALTILELCPSQPPPLAAPVTAAAAAAAVATPSELRSMACAVVGQRWASGGALGAGSVEGSSAAATAAVTVEAVRTAEARSSEREVAARAAQAVSFAPLKSQIAERFFFLQRAHRNRAIFCFVSSSTVPTARPFPRHSDGTPWRRRRCCRCWRRRLGGLRGAGSDGAPPCECPRRAGAGALRSRAAWRLLQAHCSTWSL